MCNIFTYFEYYINCPPDMIDDLNNFSLVNSHWLYHVWNLNSIHCVDLTYLMTHHSKHDDDQEDSDKQDNIKTYIDEKKTTQSPFHLLQRLIKAKHIKFDFLSYQCDQTIINRLLLKKLQTSLG